MMPPENKKHGLPTDLLSNLPENVMNAILMRLPLRDAVRTSILSNKWRYKWCRLPQLTLDDELWEATNDLLSPSIKFTNIMYHILTLHSGPITKFTLSIYELKKYPKIGSLIYFLSRNDIQHLVLTFSRWNRYRLPPSFFACSQLRHLTLQNCVICPPPAFRGFDMLICLELRDVTISSKLLESLISYSSLLEKLVLKISDTLDRIQIKAPKLRSFDFTGCLKNISLEDVPLLAKLSLSLGRSFEESENCDLDRFFQSLPALEHLHLEERSVQFLVAGAAEVSRRLSFPLNHIKRLYVSVEVLDDLLCVLCLIRNSPYLQDLEMQVYCAGPDKYSGEHVAIDEVFARFSDVTLNHLRTVHLELVIDVKLHMQLIKLLLTKSPMLVKMLIKPSTQSCDYGETRNKIVAELTIIQRASCKAEVVVYDDYEGYY